MVQPMKKLFLILFLVCVLDASAGPIGVERAKELASKFFNENATRSTAATVELEWAGSSVDGDATRSTAANVDEALLYVFNRTDDKGFVVLSGEDSYDHVMAFSYEGRINMQALPESARFIFSSMCDDIAYARQNAPESTRADDLEYDLGVGNIVVNYQTAKWAQGEPYNRECPIWYDNPNRTITCCVATGMAIVMYHHKWPESGVGTIGGYISYNDPKKNNPARSLGRTYRWDKMLPQYITGQYNSENANAVAALMFDCGTGLQIHYGVDLSLSYLPIMPDLYKNNFGYTASAVYLDAGKAVNTGQTDANGNYIYKYVPGDFTYEEWIEAIERNLLDFGPTNVSIKGHAIVYDAFTDKHYIGINHGWGGISDGFYYLPDYWRSDGSWYYPNTNAVFYVRPVKTSADASFFQIKMSGTNSGIEVRDIECFKQNEPFTLTLGQVQNMSSTFNGDIAVVLCDAEGKVVETLSVKENTSIASKGLYYPNTKLTITKPIQPGYRIRIYYKDKNATEWKWARRNKLRAVDEVVVCASPEDIAKMTSLHYVPDTKKLSLRTSLTLDYEIKNEADEVVASGVKKGAGGRVVKDGQYYDSEVVFDLSKFEKGNYTVSLSCGSEPYIFVLTI